jgi:ATP/ADP translocase
MKDLKSTIIKLIISAIILAIAFSYLEKKPTTTAIHFDTSKNQKTEATPSQLQWYDSFKGIENLPSKPKQDN